MDRSTVTDTRNGTESGSSASPIAIPFRVSSYRKSTANCYSSITTRMNSRNGMQCGLTAKGDMLARHCHGSAPVANFNVNTTGFGGYFHDTPRRKPAPAITDQMS